MRHSVRKYLLLAAVLLIPLSGWAQKRIYTRSFQIQDFKSKTTKVVLGGSRTFNASLRQEVTTFWTASPYEFCTPDEYESQKSSPDCYFLRPEISKGIIFLTLSRGGQKDATDAHKLPVTVVSLPVAGKDDDSELELACMPIFISILQDYVDAAINSEYVAYTGLRSICKRMPKDITVYTEPEEAREAIISQYTDSAVQILITPDGNPKSKPRYRLLVDTSSYALYSYGKN